MGPVSELQRTRPNADIDVLQQVDKWLGFVFRVKVFHISENAIIMEMMLNNGRE